MKRENQQNAYLYALSAVLLWSTIAVAFKVGLSYLDPWQMVFAASLSSFVFFLFFNLLRGGLTGIVQSFHLRDIAYSALLGLLNPFLYYIILIHAYSMITAQEAMTLNYIWPLMLALLSVPLLRQKLGAQALLAMLISFAGIILIATRGDFRNLVVSDLRGDLLAAGSSLIWALYWILNLKDHRTTSKKMLWNFLFGTVYAFIGMTIFSGWTTIPLKGWLAGTYLGLFEMGITFLLWLTALQLSGKTYLVSQFIFIAPFLSLLWIRIVLKEPVLPFTVAGLILIIAGIVLQQRAEMRRAAKTSPGK